jgi:cytoskeleton protein RodZ
MFALGPSLREARLKRGLELDAVQKALRIRRRYLEALEDERFELIPGEVYARGFLREYAEFLGLDSTLYVDEYNARFAHHDDVPIAARPSAPRLRRERRVPAAVAVAALLVVGGGALAWTLGGRSDKVAQTQTPPPAATHSAPQPKPKPLTRPPAPQPARLVLTASRGDCWVLLRVGSANGPVLYEQTLRQGSSVRFTVKHAVWLRVGHGANLDASLRGKPLRNLPAITGDVLVKS